MVLSLCSYVNVLDFGIKIAAGTPSEIRNDKAVRAAYLGGEIPTANAAAQAEDTKVLS